MYLRVVMVLFAACCLCSADTGEWVRLTTQGTVQEKSGNYGSAEALHREALAITQKLDPTGVETATVIHNLAAVYHQTGRISEAEQAYEKALHMFKQRVGTSHVFVRRMEMSILAFYADTQQPGKGDSVAAALRKHLESSSEEIAPLERAQIAAALGLFAHSTNNFNQALFWYEKSASIWATIPGELSDHSAFLFNNYGSLLVRMGRLAKAREVLTRAHDATRRVVGEDHPYFHRSLLNLASLASAEGRPTLAAEYLDRAIHLATRAFGPDHVHTAQLMASYRSLGGYANNARARRMAERGSEILARHSREHGLDRVIDARSFARSKQ